MKYEIVQLNGKYGISKNGEFVVPINYSDPLLAISELRHFMQVKGILRFIDTELTEYEISEVEKYLIESLK